MTPENMTVEITVADNVGNASCAHDTVGWCSSDVQYAVVAKDVSGNTKGETVYSCNILHHMQNAVKFAGSELDNMVYEMESVREYEF